MIQSKISNFLEHIYSFLTSSPKAYWASAITRIGLGLSALGLFITQLPTIRYTYGSGSAWTEQQALPAQDIVHYFPFSIFRENAYSDGFIALFAIVFILVGITFTLGIFGKTSAILLIIMQINYIDYQNMVHDQGDNFWRIAMILLLFTRCNDKLSPWPKLKLKLNKKPAGEIATTKNLQLIPIEVKNASHNLAVGLIVFQLALVYGSGALYKAGGKPWSEGWALYDPLQVTQFSTQPAIAAMIIGSPVMLAAASYFSVLMQMAFPFLIFNKWGRRIMLIGFTGFHIGIAVLMGLPWFSASFIAADFLLLSDGSIKKIIAFGKNKLSRKKNLPVPSETIPTERRNDDLVLTR